MNATTTGQSVELTEVQAASPFGQRLIRVMLWIGSDGEITPEEVHHLLKVLRDGPSAIPAVPYLRGIVWRILDDGEVSGAEQYELRRAMEAVAPPDVREQLSQMLASIGLPSARSARRASQATWKDDPATHRQIEFIRSLGGGISEGLTKGEASEMIESLLDRSGPTCRQQMVLRFFGRTDLLQSTKSEVSDWLDALYASDPAYQLAWERYKLSVGDRGDHQNASSVPIGAYTAYLPSTQSPPHPSQRPMWGLKAVVALVIAAIVVGFVLVLR